VKGQRGRLLLGVVLAAALLVLVFWKVDWDELRGALETARLGPLLALSATTVAVYAFRAWRLGYLLAPLGTVRFADLFSATYVGFAAGLVIPRAQEILRPWLISRRYPIPLSAGFASIVIERLVDLITVLILFALYLFVLPTPAQQTGGALMGVVKMAGAGTAVVAMVVLAVLLALHSHADRVLALLEKVLAFLPAWAAGPLRRIIKAFSDGLAVLRAPPGHLAAIFAQSFALWLLICVGFHFNHAAFGLDLPYRATFLLIAFLTVGVAIPTPGMVGGFHAFYLVTLHEMFGVDRATAAAAGLTAHAFSFLPILVIGLPLLWREGLSLGRVAAVTEEEGSSASLQEVQS
jgi:uncharacterized protein (TIRG00374 family)